MNKEIDVLIHSLKGGGAERVCTTLCNNLVQRGYKVNLILMHCEDSKYLKNLDSSIELIIVSKTKNLFKSFFILNKYIKKSKPRLLFSFNNNITLLLLLLRRVMNYKYKIYSRNINTLSLERQHEKSFFKKHILHAILKKKYHKVDLVICQSTGMKKDLIENYNFYENQISVINNPVNPMFTTKANEVFHLDSAEKIILFVGRLEHQKGLDYLLDSFMYLKKSFEINNVKLKIVGEGSLKTEVSKKIKKLKLEGEVEIIDFTENIRKLYEIATVTVLTSYYEGFPNVLVESISVGTPVVSFDCPSGPSEIINNTNGYLVEYLNSKAMAEALYKSLNNKWDKDEIIKSSEAYSIEYIMSKYISVLFK